MFRLIVMTVLAVGCAIGEVSVPKDATEIESGVYRHTDSTGKTYIFRKTPFGIVKSLEKTGKPEKRDESVKDVRPAPSTAATTTDTPFGQVKSSASADRIKVSDRGDSLEFERPSPFGSYKWKRKKDNLTASEREAWDHSRQQTTTAPGPKV
jgi:hypothetical protein